MTKLPPPDDEFPILCETCLGTNPNIVMTKELFGKECKICNRPFTIFRWKPQIPGGFGRYKKTEICPLCAKEKNVCQTCILDLQHGLPVHVRDTLIKDLGSIDEVQEGDVAKPKTLLNLDYHYALQRMRGEDKSEVDDGTGSDPTKIEPTVREAIDRLSHAQPYHKRNQAKVCSFWVAGNCKRGDLCPYLHEMPKTGPLAKQNIKDRYNGTNDPVANKMLKKIRSRDEEEEEMINLADEQQKKKFIPIATPPSDPSITSLWIVGTNDQLTEADITNSFAEFGTVRSVYLLKQKNSAIVTFLKRTEAEQAMRQIVSRDRKGSFQVKDKQVKVRWGKTSTAPTTAVDQGKDAITVIGGRKDYD